MATVNFQFSLFCTAAIKYVVKVRNFVPHLVQLNICLIGIHRPIFLMTRNIVLLLPDMFSLMFHLPSDILLLLPDMFCCLTECFLGKKYSF